MYLKWTARAQDQGKTAQEVMIRNMGISSGYAKFIRHHGECLVNGVHARMIDHVQEGDVIELMEGLILEAYRSDAPLIARLPRSDSEPQWISSAPPIHHPMVLDQDPWMAILNKPAGLTTHARFPGARDAIDAALGLDPIHPVNRLDRHTSGLVVLARNAHAHYRLAQTTIEKHYLGIVHGQWTPLNGMIDLPIGRREGSMIEREVRRDGQAARTEYQTLCVWEDLSLVMFKLHTGRTHQIRVHCQAQGHPLVGDTLYGTDQVCQSPQAEWIQRPGWHPTRYHQWNQWLDRQALHSWHLEFQHPIDGQTREYYAPLFPDMLELLQALGEPQQRGSHSQDWEAKLRVSVPEDLRDYQQSVSLLLSDLQRDDAPQA